MANKSNLQLKRAIHILSEFLKTHPHLIPMQKEIDRQLCAAGEDVCSRMKVIYNMLEDLINNELIPESKKLVEISNKLTNYTFMLSNTSGEENAS